MDTSLAFSQILGATLVGLISVSSLFGGGWIGFAYKPAQRVSAIIMAFGTGALIEAVALDLAYSGAQRLIQLQTMSGFISWLWVAGGFVAGGMVYYIGNRFLDARGAALRHPALAKLYMLNKKIEQSEAVLRKLSKVELIRSLPPEEMEDVLVCVQPEARKRGEIIFKKGDNGDALFFIDEGSVDILSNGAMLDAGNARLAQLGPGQSFGEMALLTGEPRLASAIAASDVSLLKIHKVHFDELIDRSPNLRRAVEELNSQRLLKNVESTRGKVDQTQWQKVAIGNIQRLTRAEEVSMLQAEHSAPLALFLGAMLDTIPESIVIGSAFSSFSTLKLTFLVSVFISNIPEAMASSAAMREAGFSKKRVMLLWGILCFVGTIASGLGNAFIATAPPTILTLVSAIAGGGILAMVSSVMMPEAYEDGGPSVGLATIVGFLTAFLFSFL